MARPGSFRRSASHSVETSQRLAGDGGGVLSVLSMLDLNVSL